MIGKLLAIGRPLLSTTSFVKMSTKEASWNPNFFSGKGDPFTEEQFFDQLIRFQSEVRLTKKRGILFLGENHMDPTAHELEVKILSRMALEAKATGQRFSLSLEFFDRSFQKSVSNYVTRNTDYEAFVSELGPSCPSNHLDYKPILDLARELDLPVLASNCPRQFTRLVAEHGKEILETLPADCLDYLPPLPYSGPSKEYLDDFIETMQSFSSTNIVDLERMKRRAAAQSLWDATMAHSIVKALHEGDDFVAHVTGFFHVKNNKGIHEHLSTSLIKESLTTLTIVILPEDKPQFSQEDHHGLGDLVVLTDINKID